MSIENEKPSETLPKKSLLRIPILLPEERAIVVYRTTGRLIEIDQPSGLSPERAAKKFIATSIGLGALKAIGPATVRSDEGQPIAAYGLTSTHNHVFNYEDQGTRFLIEAKNIDEHLKHESDHDPIDIALIKYFADQLNLNHT